MKKDCLGGYMVYKWLEALETAGARLKMDSSLGEIDNDQTAAKTTTPAQWNTIQKGGDSCL